MGGGTALDVIDFLDQPPVLARDQLFAGCTAGLSALHGFSPNSGYNECPWNSFTKLFGRLLVSVCHWQGFRRASSTSYYDDCRGVHDPLLAGKNVPERFAMEITL
jgi:hypothetical protein